MGPAPTFANDPLSIKRAKSAEVLARPSARQAHASTFRLAGHEDHSQNPTGEAGGFHRGHRSIFLDFTLIPPASWPIIFAHELLHAMDSRMMGAIAIYGDQARVRAIAALARSGRSIDQLTLSERESLDEWLRAGLDRGFLGEVRAWTDTFEIYAEGLAAGDWGAIAWLEAILAQRSTDETHAQFAMRYLDPRFTDPADGIFSHALIGEALRDLRARLRSSPIPSILRDLEP